MMVCWALATLVSFVLFTACAVSLYLALAAQREGIPTSRYWREPPKDSRSGRE